MSGTVDGILGLREPFPVAFGASALELARELPGYVPIRMIIEPDVHYLTFEDIPPEHQRAVEHQFSALEGWDIRFF
jgi:hypothetical protein